MYNNFLFILKVHELVENDCFMVVIVLILSVNI